MLMKLIPLVLALVGLGAGVGAGIALRPAPEAPMPAVALEHGTYPCGEAPDYAKDAALTDAAQTEKTADGAAPVTEFVKMPNQFVIPIIRDGMVGSMVVLSLTIEVPEGQTDAVHQRKPKLRDEFLRALLDHANIGGFDGAFTANGAMDNLHTALVETARAELGGTLKDVLITEINKQDI